MNAVVDGSEVIMGEWTETSVVHRCCFYDGACDLKSVDVFGYAEQINVDPTCCFSVNHDVDTFCASDF